MIIKKNKKLVQTEDDLSSLDENGKQITQSVDNTEEQIDIFDLDNIDFRQRNERRRGDRRRGFRRIDDRNLISRAKEEANSIREAASKEGYQQGLNQAQDDINLLRENINQFCNAKQEVYDSIAPDILEISIDIAKKIIKKEVSENPEIMLENIKLILHDLSKEESKIMLKVNPSQVDLLQEQVPQQVALAGLEAKVVVIPDENITEGGCLVTTTNGVIDATIEVQIDIICRALKET